MKKAILIFILLMIIVQLLISCTGSDNNIQTIANSPVNNYKKYTIPLTEDFEFNTESNNSNSIMFYRDNKLYMLGFIIYKGEAWSRDSALYVYDFITDTADYEILIPNVESAFINHLVYDSDTNRITIETVQTEEEYSVILNNIDSNGNEIFSTNVTDFNITGQIQKVRVDNDNIIYIAYDDGIAAISNIGTLLYNISFNNQKYSDFNILNNGDVYVKLLNTSANRYDYRYIDKNKKSFGDIVNTTADIVLYDEKDIYPGFGDEYEFYFKDETNLYGYNKPENQLMPLMNWSQNNLSAKSMRGLTVVSPETIVYCSYNTLTNKYNLEILRVDIESETTEIQIIKLGYLEYITPAFEQKVINFNNMNTKYKIELVSYYDPANYAAGIENFNKAVISNDVPDIMIYSQTMPIRSYFEKGMFIDLYPYLDNDMSVSRDDIFDFLLEPYEYNNKLYVMNTAFAVTTTIGKTKNVGENNKWSYKDVIEMEKNLPQDTKLAINFDKYYLFANMISRLVYEFIDQSTNMCDFNNAVFLDILNISKSAESKSITDMTNEEINYYYDNYNSFYQNDGILLLDVYIYTMSDLLSCMARFNFEPITIKGSPTIDGTKHFSGILPQGFLVTSQSKAKDGAWQFISYMLSDEMQTLKSDTSGLPAVKNSFYSLYDKYEKSYYYVDNAGDLIVADYAWDENVILNAGYTEVFFTEEYRSMLLGLINNVQPRLIYDLPLRMIMWEEIEIFINSDISAEETANKIQNRVSIYLSE